MIRKQIELAVMPVIVIGGWFLAAYIGGFIEDAWDGFVGPFLFTVWVGMGFTFTWDMVKEQMHVQAMPPFAVALTGFIVAFVFFSMLGGFGALINDPWLFGVAVWPGIHMAMPWITGHLLATKPGGESGQATEVEEPPVAEGP
jgi:hypothetical protein